MPMVYDVVENEWNWLIELGGGGGGGGEGGG